MTFEQWWEEESKANLLKKATIKEIAIMAWYAGAKATLDETERRLTRKTEVADGKD